MRALAPRVSVCVANYNGMEVIDACLRSLQDQLGPGELEILVHDDASGDGSVAHLRAHYPQVRLIASEENVGFCIANNRMAAQARGAYLLLLNNDAALYPDALKELLAEAGRIGKPAILTLPQYDAGSGLLVDRGCLLDPFFNPVPNRDPGRSDVAMVIGACLWLPKSLWDELDGFPEWFGSIAEDMYLCCRARLAGHAVRALAVSGYRHWQGKSFGGGKVVKQRLVTRFGRRQLSERNKTFTMLLSHPLAVLLPTVPLHLASLLLEGLVLALLARNLAVWQKIYAPLLPALWRQRRQLVQLRRSVQAHRKITLSQWCEAFSWLPHKIRLLLRHGTPSIT